MGPIKYLFLDCDNTLVLSEALAFEACADLSNEILEKHGFEDRYTGQSLLKDFVGQNFRGMLKGLMERYNISLSDDELEEYVSRELSTVTDKLSKEAEPCPGAPEEIEKIYQNKTYPMAVVSTSAKSRVVASLEKTHMDHYFPNEHVFSAATTLDPPTSKPDPAIYLHACKVLNVKPEETVTVEDSKSGATAAMRAGVPLIAYVGVYKIEDGEEKMHEMAKLLTEQCKAKTVMYDWKEFPEKLKEIENS